MASYSSEVRQLLPTLLPKVLGEERAAGVPEVWSAVQLDAADAGRGRPVEELAVDVARFERCAVSRGEHEDGFGPQPTGGFLRQLVFLQAELKRSHAYRRQRKRGRGGFGPGLVMDKAPGESAVAASAP